MFEIVIYFLLGGLIIVGMCDLMHSVWMLLLRPKNRSKGTYVICLNGESDFLTLSQLYEKQKWHGDYFADRIVAISSDDTNKELVSQFSQKGILFVNKNSFTEDLFF